MCVCVCVCRVCFQLVLTKEQAATLHSLNMDAYKELKQRLLTTTVLLTASGAGVAGLVAGIDGALPFAIGGLAGTRDTHAHIHTHTRNPNVAFDKKPTISRYKG